ncbi:hypothetical protein L596_005553 [Steinernema carpocapsae]|uniref:Uncharacterized protein n=1 Tax=Steinernema carpocapsae TaxID=34508 RepID=A0A4U8UZF9_STECR|nr:hypothetical protein L596_005553 [Steinernema carpocapsae]
MALRNCPHDRFRPRRRARHLRQEHHRRTADDNFLDVLNRGQEAIDLISSIVSEFPEDDGSDRHSTVDVESNPDADAAAYPIASRPSSVVTPLKPTLREFHGDPLRYQEFWQLWSSQVGDKPYDNITKAQTFLGLLKGPALRAVEGYSPTAENYKHMVFTIQRRFGNPAAIKRALHAELHRLPRSSNRTSDLRHTHEILERITRQLAELGEDINHPQVEAIITSKWPHEFVSDLLRRKELSRNGTPLRCAKKSTT